MPRGGKIRANLEGARFRRLQVLSRDPERPGNWLCRCDCGAEVSVQTSNLRAGRTTSCGCWNRERLASVSADSKQYRKHTFTSEYHIWACLRDRCRNPRSKAYSYYGGRGITVCERWDSFDAFLDDMGPRPSRSHSVERINNDGPYSPENCKWATPAEQRRNSRRVYLITHAGETMVLTDWADRIGVKPHVLSTRIHALGWPVEKALTTPVRLRRRGEKQRYEPLKPI